MKSQNLACRLYHPRSLLAKITDAYGRDEDLANLLLDEYFLDVTAKYQQAVRDVVALAVQEEFLYQHSQQLLPTLIAIVLKTCQRT